VCVVCVLGGVTVVATQDYFIRLCIKFREVPA
jgi:hypothetical protein